MRRARLMMTRPRTPLSLINTWPRRPNDEGQVDLPRPAYDGLQVIGTGCFHQDIAGPPRRAVV